MVSAGFPLAFLAGLLSFVSPCVLPLVPVYLGYLSGSNLSVGSSPDRRRVLPHALLFVGGFTLVFVVVFGLPATLLAGVLGQYTGWITKIGGSIVILFGLHTMGLFKIPALDVIHRASLASGTEPTFVRSILFGVTFAAGWTPCIGPLLGAVVTLALTEPSRGAGLTLTYALGLGIPFLVTAALLTRTMGWLRRLNRHRRAVEIVTGMMMVVTGSLLVSGTFTLLNSFLIRVTPRWLIQYL